MTLIDLLNLSKEFYSSTRFKEIIQDSKYKKIEAGYKFNFDNQIFNKEKKKWESKKNQSVRFVFLIKSINKDTKKETFYPVTFLFEDFSLGLKSPIKIRVGSQDKPQSKKAPNNKYDNIQSQFLFNSEFLYSQYEILYGIDRTEGKPPNKKNPKGNIYLDKHSLWVIHNVLLPILEQLIK